MSAWVRRVVQTAAAKGRLPLERGNLTGVSPAVLESIARALQLDEVERAHLLHLAQAQEGSDTLARPRSRSSRQRALPKSLHLTPPRPGTHPSGPGTADPDGGPAGDD